MKKIRLVPALELGNKVNVDVMDSAEEGGAERKRCGITLDYSRRDVAQLQDQGLDMDGMLDYYRQKTYDLVKVNISQDWECTGGMEEVMAIVRRHLEAVLEA